ncbi:hypothetical protein B0H12DRAFT_1108078 [Mycena haematopus]|nr:hypothetical protein B0H12DRAFT_1146388 [Mycena haematopus]KAJ7259948.1 hypothetical protein B0H12DRAFT_1108078 [Mycena haematopus]
MSLGYCSCRYRGWCGQDIRGYLVNPAGISARAVADLAEVCIVELPEFWPRVLVGTETSRGSGLLRRRRRQQFLKH